MGLLLASVESSGHTGFVLQPIPDIHKKQHTHSHWFMTNKCKRKKSSTSSRPAFLPAFHWASSPNCPRSHLTHTCCQVQHIHSDNITFPSRMLGQLVIFTAQHHNIPPQSKWLCIDSFTSLFSRSTSAWLAGTGSSTAPPPAAAAGRISLPGATPCRKGVSSMLASTCGNTASGNGRVEACAATQQVQRQHSLAGGYSSHSQLHVGHASAAGSSAALG